MSVYLSDAIYIDSIESGVSIRNRPLVGYKSFYSNAYIAGDSQLGAFDAQHGAQNVWTPDTHSYFLSETASGNEILSMAFNGSGADCNYIGIAGHNLGDIGSTLAIQRWNGTAWETILNLGAIVGNEPIFAIFSTVNASEFRISVLVQNGQSVRIGHVKIGQYLRLQRPPYVGVTPLLMGVDVDAVVSESGNNTYLGTTVLSASLRNKIIQTLNTPDHVRSDVVPFINHMQCLTTTQGNPYPSGTCFYAWRPDDYPREVGYCWGTKAEFQNTHSNGRMQWILDISVDTGHMF